MTSRRASPLPSAPLAGDEEVFLFPASYAQRRLWFIQQLEGAAIAYNEAFALRFRGRLDREALQAALDWLERRHETLRTVFALDAGEPVQVIRPPRGFPLEQEDLSHRGDQAEEAARAHAAEEASRPFDLARGPLLRARLYRLTPMDHVLALSAHHIIIDDWTIKLLERELLLAYASFRDGKEPALASPRIQYADYSVWQQEAAQKGEHARHLETWRARLASPVPVLKLPTDRARLPVQTYPGHQISKPIDPKHAAALRELAREEQTTLSTAMLTAFQLLLSRHSGQTDFVLGTPVANRNRAETEGVAGFFLNMLPIRADLSGGPGFRELLRRTREVFLEAFAAQDVPFEQLVDVLRQPRDWSRHPLFQTAFAMMPREEQPASLEGLAVEIWPIEPPPTAKFDLFLAIHERANELEAVFEFNTDLFDEATMREMADRFGELLASIAREPDRNTTTLNILPPAERHRLLEEWNETTTAYPRDLTIVDLFESQARATPDAIAVSSGGSGLSYAGLDAAADRLARRLRGLGVAAGRPVGVCSERSVSQIVALLGILKADGAYVPLDPSYPPARLATMIEESELGVIVVDRADRTLPPGAGGAAAPTLVLADQGPAENGNVPGALPRRAGPAAPAYVMFTSGSAGVPKGVVIPHRGVVRLARGMDYLPPDGFQRVLGFASVSFDASTFEIWGPLLNGGTLVLAPAGALSLAELGAAIEREAVQTVFLTTALFHEMVDRQLESLRGVRFLLTGGEVISPLHVRKALEALPECRMIHLYGPTENSAFTTWLALDQWDGSGPVPIGRPVANTTVYILDELLQPVPRGAVGILFTGGDGLAAGYYNRPDFTAERFISHPFRTGERLYRTGDLARYRPNGLIEFHGREDGQIKLRGFRIEPGEIEATLLSHPDVVAGAVVARQPRNGERILAGYYSTRDGMALSQASLKQFLKSRLPDFMVPAVMVHLGSLPVSPAGKVDRRALPDPEPAQAPTANPPSLPRSTLETVLLHLWQELLPGRPIGVEDDFFELGGHSLLAARMVDDLEHATGRRLPLATLFQGATIREVTDYLLQHTEGEREPDLIEVQRGGTALPFFMLHGDMTGAGFYCRQIAAAAGPDQPIYALSPVRPDGSPDSATIEGMAARHLVAIRSVQPHGPYALGGYCIGGIVAFEIARMLRSAGERVDLLFLADTGTTTARLRRFAPLIRFVARVTEHDPIARIERSGYLLQRLSRALALPPFQRLRYFLGAPARLLGRRLHRIKSHLVPDTDAVAEVFAPHEIMMRHHTRAMQAYCPGFYDGRIHLLLAAEGEAAELDLDGGWQEVAREVVTFRVPGNHNTILFAELPRLVRQALADARAACGAGSGAGTVSP